MSKDISEIERQIKELEKQKAALQSAINVDPAQSLKAELDQFSTFPTFDDSDRSDANIINFFRMTADPSKWFGKENHKNIMSVLKKNKKFFDSISPKDFSHPIHDLGIFSHFSADGGEPWFIAESDCPKSANGFYFVFVQQVMDKRNSKKIYALVKDGNTKEAKSKLISNAFAYVAVSAVIDSYGDVVIDTDPNVKVVVPHEKTTIEYI